MGVKPLVTVIVTTYNRKELLKETINSILSQTFKNFELIVVDNFSSYDFLSYVESFNDVRINAFQNRNNGIIAVNRNYGISMAKGEYIAFCDDDDLWKKNKLEEQLRYFEDDNLIGTGTSLVLIDRDSCIIGERKKDKNKLLGLNDFLFDPIPLSSLIIKNVGILFDENKLFIAVEDFDLQINLLSQSKKSILCLSEPLTYYRVDSQNKSSGIQQKLNCLNVVDKYEKELSYITKNKLRQLINYRIGTKYLLLSNYNEARKYFLKSLKTVSFSNKKIVKSFFYLVIISLPKSLSEKIFIRLNIINK
jgi:glycosyltransferase involved in cell wall biosynthesis